MFLTNFLKTGLIDKHRTSLAHTTCHLKSIHLSGFRKTLGNDSISSSCKLNRAKTINRYKKYEMVLPMGIVRSPLICSNAFHTSTISNRISYDDSINHTTQKRKTSRNADQEFDEYSDNLNVEFDFINQEADKFGQLSEKHSQRKLDILMKNNIESETYGAYEGKRFTNKRTETLSSDDNNESRYDDVPTFQNNAVFNQVELEKQFPNPKHTLYNIYTIVSTNKKDNKYIVKPNFEILDEKKKRRVWRCNYNVLWPSEMSFSATATSKPVASKIAALKCLHHLLVNKKLKKGYPVLYDSNEIKDILYKPTRVEIKPNVTDKVIKLLDLYNKEIVQLLSKSEPTASKVDEFEDRSIDSPDVIFEEVMPLSKKDPIFIPDEICDPIRGTPLVKYNRDVLIKRDMEMYRSLQQHRNSQNHLPIMNFKGDILKLLEDDRVLVVKGEPGCGKSTQLPQFILDDFANKGKGTECNIIITQPRRISAISLAKRVADERNEKLGKSVGYQVRLQSVLPSVPGGRVVFCSTGILLRRLQNNPGLIGCSHVIVDEAHERDLNTDVLLVLLNRALQENPNLKVIVMSATINAELFERYFNCNIISIPGFTFPVKMHFLEDIMQLRIRGITRQDMSLSNPNIDCEQMAKLVDWITRNKPSGAILCFLPGWSEILKMKRCLEDILPPSYVILPVHSRLPHSDQALIFNRAPKEVRKIILATNIAETSITIDDVVYVVDSCAHKEPRFQHQTDRRSIDNQWVSQGNINQRKGRAGRVQPGESYHFITRNKYESLDKYPIPEILRVELQKPVLDCKTYTSEKAATFFSQMPEPPNVLAVQQAVNELLELGALNENEDLTDLGKRIALFPLDPRLSKVMVYSVIFQCVNPILTLSSILSSDMEIFTDRLYDKAPIRKLKQKFEPNSDHLALAWLFEEWNAYAEDEREAFQFCKKMQLQFGKMMLLRDLRNLFAQHLSQCRMIDKYARWKDLNSHLNKFANHDELVRGVFLAGMDRVLKKNDKEFINGRLKQIKNVMLMEDGGRATLTTDSVNYNRETWPTQYLTYQQHVHSAQRRSTLIRESSLVSPLTVLLFCPGDVRMKNHNSKDPENNDVTLILKGKKNVHLICDSETARILLDLKASIHNIVSYFIKNMGFNDNIEEMKAVESFRDQVIELLSTMLNVTNEESADSKASNNEAEDDQSV